MIRQETITNEQQKAKIIGNYQYLFTDQLGEGAFGKVFKGSHVKTYEPVAIKVMDAKFMKDQQLKESIENEVNTMKQMTNNVNVVRLIDVMVSPNNIYIIQEFCNGGDLAHFLEKQPNKRIPEQNALQVLKQLLNGFMEMVMKGIVHRDLKPENILIKDGIFKIADFGFSKNVDNFSKGMLQSLLGTPLYMAPQILLNQQYTSKCDVWSLGLIYYEMLCGKTPWEVKTQIQLIQKIKSGQIPFPNDIQISDLSKKFIIACLKEEENQRLSFDDIFIHPLFGNCFGYQEKLQEMGQKADKIIEKFIGIIFSKGIQIDQLFKTIDSSGNDLLEFDEFCKMLRYIDPSITRQQCDLLFNKFDLNGDNEISYQEFQTTLEATVKNYQKNPTLTPKVVAAQNQIQQPQQNQQNQTLNNALNCIQKLNQIVQHPNFSVEKVFWMFDTTHDLNLEFNEFTKMIRILNPEMKQEEIQLVFKIFDVNGDGNISFNEFTNGLKIDQLKNNPIYLNYLNQNQQQQQQQQQQFQQHPNQQFYQDSYIKNIDNQNNQNQFGNNMPGNQQQNHNWYQQYQNNQNPQAKLMQSTDYPSPYGQQPQQFGQQQQQSPFGQQPQQQPFGQQQQQPFGSQQPFGQSSQYNQQKPFGQPQPFDSQPFGSNQSQFGQFNQTQPYGQQQQPPFGNQMPFNNKPQSPFEQQQNFPNQNLGMNSQIGSKGYPSLNPQQFQQQPYQQQQFNQFGQQPSQQGYPPAPAPINPLNTSTQYQPNQPFQQAQPYGQQFPNQSNPNQNFFNQQSFPNQQQFYQQSQVLMKQFKQNLKDNQQQIQNMINFYDQDKDGALNFNEFTNFLQGIRMPLRPDEVNTIFVTIDTQRKSKLFQQDIIAILLNPSF